MKKFLTTMLAALLALSLFSFASCDDSVDLVSVDALDVAPESFGIAVKKGDPSGILSSLNELIDEWNEVPEDGVSTLHKYIQIYSGGENTYGLADGWDEWEAQWAGATETLTMYTESGFAPYEYVQGDKIVGVDVALAAALAVKLNCKLEIKDVNFDSIITNLNGDNGKAIAAAGLSITPERQEEVDFSKVYATTTLSIVSKADKSYNKLQDLNGLKIGVQEGTSGDFTASDAVAGEYSFESNGEEITVSIPDAQVVQYKTYSAALADLKAGRIDVIFMDHLPSMLLIKNS